MKTVLSRLAPARRQSYTALLRLGFPVLVTQIGIIVVSFADTMMVGAYGLNELAAAAFVNSLFVIAIVMLIGFAGGVTPLIGALYGRGEKEEAGRTLRASLQVNVLLAVAFTALMGGLWFLLPHFGQDPDILPAARQYYLIVLATMVPVSVFNCFQQAANGTTDTATPMWIILITDALNILGNWVLIFGHWGCPEMGLLGAGISTLAARTVGAVLIVAVFSMRKRYRPYWRAMKTMGAGAERRRKVWTTSYPLMIQSGIECGLWTLGAVVSGWFGKVQLAAYQVINTIAQLGFMTYMSFGWATSIRVANFTGTNDFKGIRRTTVAGLHLNFVLCTAASLVFFFFTKDMVHFFTPEAEVISEAVLLIWPLILYQFCDATQLTYVNALRGTSVVKPLLWISLVSYLAVGVPCLLLLASVLDLETVGVYYSFSVALLTASVLLIVTFKRVMRRKEASVNTL